MSGKNSVVSMTLQLNGKQAQQVLQQFLQTQKTSAAEILKTNRNLEGVLRQQAQQTSIQAKQYQQMSKLVQQQHTALAQSTVQTQATLRTNQLLERVLQQQVRQSTLLTQNNRNQNRDYQLQLNILRQQVAAAERLRQQLEQAGRANREMNRGGGGLGGGAMQNTAAAVGATYAAGSLVTNYLNDPRQYMKQISLATDTALGSKNVSIQEFNQKVMQMEGFVRNAAVKGGSTPQDTVVALNKLTSSNVFSFEELQSRLLDVSKTAFASGALPEDIAAMQVAQRRYGLSNLDKATDQAFMAGKLGSFELRDMARYMPDLLTQGSRAGYKGEKGYQDLLTMMQVSMRTAADPSQAATNMSDLLGSFSQHHFGLQIAKFITPQAHLPQGKYGVAKKKEGVDWAKYSADRREHGVSQFDAAAELIHGEMMISPLYQKYQAKTKLAAKAMMEKKKQGLSVEKEMQEYQTNLEAAIEIVEQSVIGKIFHNKQQLAAYTALAMSKGEGGDFAELNKEISNSEGAKEASHARQSAQEYGKDGSLDTARFNARVDNYNGVSGWLGNLKQSLADFASSNSGIAAAASAAVIGLTAVGAAGGVAALAMRTGGGGVGGAAAGAAGGAVMGAVRTAGQVGLAGVLGYGVGTAARNMYMQTDAGQWADDKIGSGIAHVLAAFGNDEAQAAIEAQAKYDEMIKQQQEANEHSRETNKNFNTLISVVRDSQGMVPNFNQLFAQQSLNQQQNVVGDRQGAVPFMLQKH